MRLETNIDNENTIKLDSSDDDKIYQIFDSYDQQHNVFEENDTNNSPIDNPYGYLDSMVPGPVNVAFWATFTARFGPIFHFCCFFGNIF